MFILPRLAKELKEVIEKKSKEYKREKKSKLMKCVGLIQVKDRFVAKDYRRDKSYDCAGEA